MTDGGYDNSDARRAGCGCVVVGGVAVLVAWVALFGLSLGDCLAPDNVACHGRAVRETMIIGVALIVFLVVCGGLIAWRFFRRK
jgi:hypothetical protein